MADVLWAPWRMDYIKNVSDGPKECFLCALATAPQRDEENLVIARSPFGALLLNRYPYVHGHLLIAPYRHVADLTGLAPAERAEMMELLMHAQRLLGDVMNPQGYNIGMNLGRCAGAGVPGHVHMHIVPRWNGDVNFMAVIGQVHVIPQAMEESYRQLSAAHRKLVRGAANQDKDGRTANGVL